MIVVVLWRHFFSSAFRRGEPRDLPAPMPAVSHTPGPSLFTPVDQGRFDTWIYQAYRTGKGYPVLYCWVPNAFVADMQAAMDVHVLDNYEWVDVEQLLPDYQQ